MDYTDEATVKSTVPLPRRSHMAVLFHGRIVVFGGLVNIYTDSMDIDAFESNVIWTYKLDSDRWEKFVINSEDMPPPLVCACVVAIGSKIYVHGGCVGKLEFEYPWNLTNKTWELTKLPQHGFKWHEIKFENESHAPSPRQGHSGWEYHQKMWTYGGHGVHPDGYIKNARANFEFHFNDIEAGFNNQLLCFDPAHEEWSDIGSTGAVPPPGFPGISLTGNTVWLYDHPDYLFQLNMQSLHWTKLPMHGPVKPVKRERFTFTEISAQKLMLNGGHDIDTFVPLSDTWILDLTSRSWKLHQESMGQGRYSHSATKTNNNKVIIFGGCVTNDLNESFINDVHVVRLDPESLVKLATEAVYKHRMRQDQWNYLPQTLHTLLTDMCYSDNATEK